MSTTAAVRHARYADASWATADDLGLGVDTLPDMWLDNGMTNTDLHTFTATTYGVDFGSLSADAEAVIRRCHEAGQAPALDLFRGLDGLVYVRFDA